MRRIVEWACYTGAMPNDPRRERASVELTRELRPHFVFKGIEVLWDLGRAVIVAAIVAFWQWFAHHWDIVTIIIAFAVPLVLLVWRDWSRSRARAELPSGSVTSADVGGAHIQLPEQIEITSPVHGQVLADPKPLGPNSVSYPVRGRLKRLPDGQHKIWLLVAHEGSERCWPQGFYSVDYDNQTGEWNGRVNAGNTPLRIIAVVAPPTSQDLFRYFQKRGDETKSYVPLERVPPECSNRASVVVRLP
jgi:hypothetical protein